MVRFGGSVQVELLKDDDEGEMESNVAGRGHRFGFRLANESRAASFTLALHFFAGGWACLAKTPTHSSKPDSICYSCLC